MQPEVFLTHKKTTEAERNLAAHYRETMGPYTVYMWEQMRPIVVSDVSERAGKEGFTFLDVNGAFDSTGEKAFTDYCHLSPLGDELVARKLAVSVDAILGAGPAGGPAK